MFNVAGGGGRDGRRSIIDDTGRRVVAQVRKKNTGAGSGPSEHWVGRIENVTIKKVKDKIAPWPFP